LCIGFVRIQKEILHTWRLPSSTINFVAIPFNNVKFKPKKDLHDNNSTRIKQINPLCTIAHFFKFPYYPSWAKQNSGFSTDLPICRYSDGYFKNFGALSSPAQKRYILNLPISHVYIIWNRTWSVSLIMYSSTGKRTQS